jgi:hypothetical protein
VILIVVYVVTKLCTNLFVSTFPGIKQNYHNIRKLNDI